MFFSQTPARRSVTLQIESLETRALPSSLAGASTTAVWPPPPPNTQVTVLCVNTTGDQSELLHIGEEIPQLR